ncbi:hypothetical protein [Anthocerotibacter panamensis]|uniref:hypothetical protein n=1 Tax=Anthocerotibacter panamensis TaxID=2857077 RepID=UPI001C406B34|nr:hypothetical protein [Anthocerotibacter panamensis]
MQIPSFFYGLYPEVQERCQLVVRQLAQGHSWENTIDTDHLLDTATTPGLLMLHGPTSLYSNVPNFHCYPLWRTIKTTIADGRLPLELEEPIFQASLETAWGTLGLLCYYNANWTAPPHRYQPFLDAVLRFWDTLYAEGARYSTGIEQGEYLHRTSTNIHSLMGDIGVPDAILYTHLTAEGPAAMLRQMQQYKPSAQRKSRSNHS